LNKNQKVQNKKVPKLKRAEGAQNFLSFFNKQFTKINEIKNQKKSDKSENIFLSDLFAQNQKISDKSDDIPLMF
jgi:hypothetical protein